MSSTSNSIFLTDFTAQNEAEEDQRLAERKQRLVSCQEELKMQKAVVKLSEDGIIMDTDNTYIII
jgi:hypothetical protein